MKQKKLLPKCFPGFPGKGKQQFGYSSKGYLLPCCWCDQNDPAFDSLLTEDLAVANNSSIEDILASDAWQEFGKSLVQNYGANAPGTCWKYCTEGKGQVKRTV